MEITPRELRDVEIHSEIRGYSRDEVNDLLERAAATIDAANERVTQMQERLNSAQTEAGRTRETEDILHRTLLLAQRAADEAVAEATAKARQMLDDAEMQSRRLVADSEAEARRKGEAERRRLEEEILDLAGRRDALLADVEALTRFEAEYRERMVRALEADLSALRSRPTAAPGTKPEPSDIELPVMPEGIRAARCRTGTSAPTPTMRQPARRNRRVARADAAPTRRAARYRAPRASRPRVSRPTKSTCAPLFESGTSTNRPTGSRRPRRRARINRCRAHRRSRTTARRRKVCTRSICSAPTASTPTSSTTTRSSRRCAMPFTTRRRSVPATRTTTRGEHTFFDQDADRAAFRDVFRRRR